MAIIPPGAPGRAAPVIGAVLLAALAYAGGRLLSQTVELRTAALLALALLAVGGVVATPGAASGEALAPPLGYGNANGALALLGAGAGLAACLTLTGRPRRAAAATLFGAAATGVAWLTASQAATVLAAALTGVALVLAVRPERGRAAPVLAASAVVLAMVGTTALGLVGPEVNGVQEALTYRRVNQWAESLDLLSRDAVRGAGHGSFAAEAPSSQLDRDVRWSHSLWLQQAAESGLPGLVLLVVPVGFVLLRVRADGWEDGGVPALGATATAALLVHGSVDYVFHFPVITAGTALLAGLTLAPRQV